MVLFNVGFVILPNVTQLDFTGPLQVLSGASSIGDTHHRKINVARSK